jgi:imidazoleglycerol-phosphate dehydratase
MKERTASLKRKTSETDIAMQISLDGTGQYDVSTGVGFLDHMLGALATHALFDLKVDASGDLHIDAHHTIEDVGIVLGQAIDQAAGDRSGIMRVGHAFVPMDESLGFVALDFSGRPYTVFQAQWATLAIGQFPTDLVQHFFESVAVHARLTLHAKVEGRNDHHKAEALFKAFARALRMALAKDGRRTGIPSTKGTLG